MGVNAIQSDSLVRHFEQQVAVYGDQYLVNLVNKSGYEKPVKEAFEKAVDAVANPRVHYTYFDFHHECKGLRFDRVSVLIDSLDEELHHQGSVFSCLRFWLTMLIWFVRSRYYYEDTAIAATRPAQLQSSVVRTNCMDW